jgi:hypothetical protein
MESRSSGRTIGLVVGSLGGLTLGANLAPHTSGSERKALSTLSSDSLDEDVPAEHSRRLLRLSCLKHDWQEGDRPCNGENRGGRQAAPVPEWSPLTSEGRYKRAFRIALLP